MYTTNTNHDRASIMGNTNTAPNSHATVHIRNCTGQSITNVKLSHRYDNDYYDDPLRVDFLDTGASSSSVPIGFWTGFLRTGYDYWHVVFECNGRKYSCKTNFYCFLTEDDLGGDVTCELYKDKMVTIPPKSSSAKVSLCSI